MATLKCKYCGGNVTPFPENDLGTCASCGAVMTLPKNTGKQHAAAHNCGNYLRRAGKFGKALEIYQKLLAEDETDAESCWCSALCLFGVQYVEDNGGGYRPVVLHPEAGNFAECGDYLAALHFSDGAVRLQYEKEAARITACLAAPSGQGAAVSPAKQGFALLKQGDFSAADSCFSRVLEDSPENAMAHLGRLLAACKCTTPKELPACGQPIEESVHYRNALQYGDDDLKKFLRYAGRRLRQHEQPDKMSQVYAHAVAAMEAAATNEEYRQAARMFDRLGDYRDAKALAQVCLNQAEVLRKDGIYQAAVAAKKQGDAAGAARLFSQIPGWRDANTQAVQSKQRSEAQKAAKSEPEHWVASAGRRIAATLLAAALVIAGVYLFITKYFIPQQKYEAAQTLLEAGNREEAIEAFQALEDFKDSAQRVLAIQEEWYSQAEVLLNAGDINRAAAIFGGLRDYGDSRERSQALWAQITQPELISAGGWYTAALRSDRMVNAIGDNRSKQCEVGSWMGIASVSAGWEHTVGLRTDGTVIAAGYNGDGRGDVDGWRNMVAVSAGQWHTVGLKSNGRVIGLGCDNDGRIDFGTWRDIIAVSAGRNHTVGLEADYTAVAVGDNSSGQCNVESWSNLLAVSAGGEHTLGLTREGKVLAAGRKTEMQSSVADWENIVAISAGYYHSVGLRADGTVVAVGDNEYGQCDVGEWKDIVAISAGGWHTLGLKSDGSIVAAGRNVNGQCEVLGWDNMMLP